ncbi:MAG: undecaprenyl/decaprenyl-phosphate alpha-N-acetylglucosaminyl 1-phosphate transferase [Anaerolineae bacterium]|nr:undecaprenyl/decaprenyl-phosphate alpha-N-acetylglucosaminyl 1-phosphate transferase [Anaerolineae bacterium]
MIDFVPILVVGFAASLGLTPVTRQLAHRIGLVDKPNARKVHLTPIPLMGGLAIYGGFIIALLMFNGWPRHILELVAIVFGTTWLAFIGFLDDKLELSWPAKFGAQILAALAVMLAGVRVDLFQNPLDWALTLFWILGIINAINFLDNMDGLAAGVSAIAAFFMFVLAASQGQELVSSLSAALCGAAIGFLIYNFNPATTFMGDMGSMVLGFMLAVCGIKLRFPSQSLAVTWMIPILVLGLPIFDTTLVVFTRLREGRSPAQAGKDHTSHRLAFVGLSTRRAVVICYAGCLFFGGAALLISRVEVATAAVIGAIVAVVAASSFIALEFVRVRQRRAQLAAQAK